MIIPPKNHRRSGRVGLFIPLAILNENNAMRNEIEVKTLVQALFDLCAAMGPPTSRHLNALQKKLGQVAAALDADDPIDKEIADMLCAAGDSIERFSAVQKAAISHIAHSITHSITALRAPRSWKDGDPTNPPMIHP